MSKRPSIIGDLGLESSRRPSEPAPPAAMAPTRKPRPEIVHTSVYIPRAAYLKLREIAYTTDVKIHDLLMEGIDAVLTKHGHPTIDEMKIRPKKV